MLTKQHGLLPASLPDEGLAPPSDLVGNVLTRSIVVGVVVVGLLPVLHVQRDVNELASLLANLSIPDIFKGPFAKRDRRKQFLCAFFLFCSFSNSVLI